MKPSRHIRFLTLVAAVATLCSAPATSKAQILYVANQFNGTVGEYSATTGATINASFISGTGPAFAPYELALSGNNLYFETPNGGSPIVDEYNATTGAAITGFTSPSGLEINAGLAVSGTDLYIGNTPTSIGEYNATTGATINATFINAVFSEPFDTVISGNHLYVADENGMQFPDDGAVGEYNATTGETINQNLISGLNDPYALAVSGNDLYVVTNGSTGTVGEYDATTGAIIPGFNSITSGPSAVQGLAVSGNDLYVANASNGTVGEYDATTGEPIVSFASSADGEVGIAISNEVPEPSTWTSGVAALGGLLLLGSRSRTRKSA